MAGVLLLVGQTFHRVNNVVKAVQASLADA
jgi:hypothetical protein